MRRAMTARSSADRARRTSSASPSSGSRRTPGCTRRRSRTAPWWGMVLRKAPHPNAAQLLMNYLVTKEGQQSSQRHLGAVLQKVPDTFYVEPRKQNLLLLTPQKVTEFQNYWNGLFKK